MWMCFMIYYLNSWLQVGIIKILRKRPKSLLLFHELFISGVCYHTLCLKFSREVVSVCWEVKALIHSQAADEVMECYRKIGERQTRASPLLSWTKKKNGGNIYIIYFLPKPRFIHENFHIQSYKKPQRHLDWMTCWIEWLVIRVFYCRFQFTEISYSKHQVHW